MSNNSNKANNLTMKPRLLFHIEACNTRTISSEGQRISSAYILSPLYVEVCCVSHERSNDSDIVAHM